MVLREQDGNAYGLTNWISTPVKLALARLAVNYCRRKVTPEEMTERISFLAKEGLKTEEIADATGIRLRTVQKYYPQELKDPVKVDAGKKGGLSAASVHQTVKTSDSPVRFNNGNLRSAPSTCKQCHVQTYNLSSDGLCGVCAEKKTQAKTVMDRVNKEVFKVSDDSFKPEEKPTFTKASESKEAQELCSCPICGTILSKADYEAYKEETGIEYGVKIQAKLFKDSETAENEDASTVEAGVES